MFRCSFIIIREFLIMYGIFTELLKCEHLYQWLLQRINGFFFISFSLLIGWQLSICNCCKPFFSLLYNCQLLFLGRLALSIVVQVFPRPFSPDIAPSRMFTTNSLCLIVCPIHEWRLLFNILKSNLSFSSFENFIIRYSHCPFYF